MKHFLLLILLSLLIGSCSITKRRYNSGWHVEWHKKHHDSNPETVVENNRSVRLSETAQTKDSIQESTSVEQPIITEPETIPFIAESESIPSTEDSPTLTESHSGTVNSAPAAIPEKTISDHEPEEKRREAFPNSERVIPIPLAVILSILLLNVGGYLTALVIGAFYLLVVFSLSGSLFIIGTVIAVFLGVFTFTLVLFLIFQLFNRKVTKYASKRERNLMYLLIAFCIASGIGLLAMISLVRGF